MVRARAKSVFVSSKEKEQIEEELATAGRSSGSVVLSDAERELYGNLFDQVLKQLPETDNARYLTRLRKIKWEKINIEGVSKETLQDKLENYLKDIRHYRNLREVIADAKTTLTEKKVVFSGVTAVTSFQLYQKENYKKIREEHPELKFSDLNKLIGKKFKEDPERDRYVQEAKTYNETNNAQFKSRTATQSNKKKNKNADPIDPHTPVDFYITEKRLKGSEKTVPDLKSSYKDLPNHKKAKYILKALYLAMNGMTPAVTKEELKILDEVEGRPKRPATAFGEFCREYRDKYSGLKEFSQVWNELPEKKKEERTSDFKRQMKEYKENMKKFLDGLSKSRRELEDVLRKKRSKNKDEEEEKEKKVTKAKKEEAKTPKTKIRQESEEEKEQQITFVESPRKVKAEKQKLKSPPPRVPERYETPSPTKKRKRTLSLTLPESEETSSVLDSPSKKKKKFKSPPPPVPAKQIKQKNNIYTSSEDEAENQKSTLVRTKKRKREHKSDDESSLLNGQESVSKKKRQKKVKKTKMPPPVQPVNTIFAYYQNHVYRGPKDKVQEAWEQVPKKQRKEYFQKIHELRDQYIRELELYLKTLSPQEVEQFSQTQYHS